VKRPEKAKDGNVISSQPPHRNTSHDARQAEKRPHEFERAVPPQQPESGVARGIDGRFHDGAEQALKHDD